MKSGCFKAAIVALAGVGIVVGCAGTKESASRDKLTANVGNYAPPPSSVASNRPKVGVPPFKVQAGQGVRNAHNLDTLAADQMSTLLHRSGRFDVVERTQMEQLLDEQNMEGIVRPDQMAKAGQVLGVDYLLIGRVTNFRVKQDQTRTGVDVGGIGGLIGGGGNRFGAGSTGFDQKKQRITTECGIDIRLVDPTNGQLLVSHFGEFKRTDSAGAMGISVFGMGANSDAQVTIEEDDAGKILRLAFDDALRKMLPEIDDKLQSRATRRPERNQGRTRTVAAPAPEASEDEEAAEEEPAPRTTRPRAARPRATEPAEEPAETEPAETEPADTEPGAADAEGDKEMADEGEDPAAAAPARRNAVPGAAKAAPAGGAAQKFCGECGTKMTANAKFCPKCGAKAG